MKTPDYENDDLLFDFSYCTRQIKHTCWLDSTEMYSLLLHCPEGESFFYILKFGRSTKVLRKLVPSSGNIMSNIGHSIPGASLRGTSWLLAQSAEELSIRNLGSHSDLATYYLCDLLHDINLSRPSRHFIYQ